ncbi:MAG: hypothetical protein M1380_06555 [Chloroflexi bacterium]|nr:hypothetical protein [Chloroflexota bacterium]
MKCGAELLRVPKASAPQPSQLPTVPGSSPASPRLRLPSLAFDPWTDWHSWRRQVFGLQGILLVLSVALALGLHYLEPYLFAPPPQQAAPGASQQETIKEVVLSRLEAKANGSPAAAYTLAALKAGGADLDGKAVRVRGEVVRDAVDESGNHFLLLSDGNDQVTAVYSGYLGNIYPKETVDVEGRWLTGAGAIDVSSAKSLSIRGALREDPATINLAVTIARGLNVVLPLFSLLIFVTRWVVTRRGRTSSPGSAGRAATTGLFLLMLAFFVSGCNVQQEVTINPDGSGEIVTTYQFDASQMDQIRGQANMNAYLTSLRDNIEAKGAKVYDYTVGSTEYIVVKRPFSSIDQVNSWEGDLKLKVANSGRDSVYDYEVTIDPSKLYPAPNDEGASQVSGELDKMQWEQTVKMPGREVLVSPQPKSESEDATSTEVVFGVPMKRATTLRYVSQLVDVGAEREAGQRLEANVAFERQLVDSVQYTSLASAVILLAALLLFRPARQEEVL